MLPSDEGSGGADLARGDQTSYHVREMGRKPGVRQHKTKARIKTPALGADESQGKLSGNGVTLGFLTDSGSDEIVGLEILTSREGEEVRVAKRFGAVECSPASPSTLSSTDAKPRGYCLSRQPSPQQVCCRTTPRRTTSYPANPRATPPRSPRPRGLPVTLAICPRGYPWSAAVRKRGPARAHGARAGSKEGLPATPTDYLSHRS